MNSDVEKLVASGKDVAPNVANGLAYPGQVFHHRLADEVGAIWLAYASSCYFGRQTNDLVEPAMAFDGFGGMGSVLHLMLAWRRWKRLEAEAALAQWRGMRGGGGSG